MLLNKFLIDHHDVCSTVKKALEAKNAVSSLKSSITIKTNSLERMAASVDKEKQKTSSSNIDKINGEVVEYLKTKQLLYELVTELRLKCDKNNSSLEVMKESPYIGDMADMVLENHLIDSDKEHREYLGKLTEMVKKVEDKTNMEREDKPAPASESIGSRPSSRTSSPSISSSNSKKFTYVS